MAVRSAESDHGGKYSKAAVTVIDIRPPFRVCINPEKMLGRSQISSAYPYSKLKPVTGKFYSRFQQDEILDMDTEELIKKFMLDPREKYCEPLLESHMYGWYNDIKYPLMQMHQVEL